MTADQLCYSISDTALNAGIPDEEARSLRRFWFKRFFSGEYILEDEPVVGASQFVRRAAEAGALPVYVSGRDESMRAATLGALKKHGFPLPDAAAKMILKPRFDIVDHEFKRSAAAELSELGEVVATFENEPLHVNLFAEEFPKAAHFLLATRHSGRVVSLHPDAVTLSDFTNA